MTSQDFITNIIKLWGCSNLSIGLTGDSGVGKSSFINAIRNLSSDDEGGAAVGVTECTMQPEPYPHPANHDVIFWDLPGVGTPTFSRDVYLERVNFDRYDFFIIFSATRFTSNDLWIAQRIKETGRDFYFVRTKIDQEIANDRRSHRRTHNEERLLKVMRTNCMDEFHRAGIRPEKIYLVSNYDVDKWDYPELKVDIIDILPTIAEAKEERRNLQLMLELRREALQALLRPMLLRPIAEPEEESCVLL